MGNEAVTYLCATSVYSQFIKTNKYEEVFTFISFIDRHFVFRK